MSTNELLDQFVLEARECLEQIGQRLLDVERTPGDTALLNDLFRGVHTLKGNCGLFEFKALERVMHAGEDLLDRVRNQSLAYSNDIADALLEAMDFAAELIDQIEAQGRCEPTVEGRSHELAKALRLHLAAPAALPVAATEPRACAEPAPAQARPAPDWLKRLPPHVRETHRDAVALRYVPEAECFFKGEDPWRVIQLTPGLQHLQVDTVEPWPAAAELDCYRCNVDFVALSDAPLASLEEHFRYVPEQVELWQGPATATEGEQAPPATAAVPAGVPPALLERARALWDDQRALLERGEAAPGVIIAVRRTLSALLPVVADTTALAALQALPDNIGSARLLAFMDSLTTHEEDLGAPVEVAEAATPEAARRSEDHGTERHGKVLKVSQDKIDRLMDLIGEMVVAKNALPYLATRAEAHFGQRELSREIKAQYAVINRIAEDMQHAIMQVRMMPVGVVFQRFSRLVRDLSRKLGKEVQLVIEGEDTEADKNVIEALADPLIHIVRNSLDHGIEMPEVRRAAGKPLPGTIRIRAHQESDRVVIEISDDGAGIHTDRVRAKAVERGLIPADKAASLSEQDAVQLIFLPGFSTADTISDLSGRGVGMDVVRAAVERLNGQVTLSSQAGQGATLRLSLPLSMAVTNVMIIEAAGRRFGVPMDLIVETVRVNAEDIHRFKQLATTVLRGRIVPLRPLHELLSLHQDARLSSDGEYAVLVVRLHGQNIGLIVDDFHGATDIILKPLEGVLAGMTSFAGTALMGDGSVLMVLNPKELI